MEIEKVEGEKEPVKAGSELNDWLGAALTLHEERFQRIIAAWLREESTWIALDLERIMCRAVLERIANIAEEPMQTENREIQIENIRSIARAALSV